MKQNPSKFLNTLTVSFFLAKAQLKRTNVWTTLLIIFIMVLTFMNVVVVNGILVGLVEGSSIAYRKQYSGDIIIQNYENKEEIKDSFGIITTLKGQFETENITSRMLAPCTLETNYKTRSNFNDKTEQLTTRCAGIIANDEDKVTNIKKFVIAGEFLSEEDEDGIVIGNNLLENYARSAPGDTTLSNIDVGSKVRVTINGIEQELTVRGVVKSKIDEMSRRVYLNQSYLRKILNKPNLDTNEIVVALKEGTDAVAFKETLLTYNIQRYGNIKTWEESQGQFFKDISATFNSLGTIIGSIGIVVASITVFIVIYINAVTRRKYIGILKAIGISGLTIELSYVYQSMFYSLLGSSIGAVLLFGVIKPSIDKNPIDFPFSDGILVAPLDDVIGKIILLLVITMIAGYIPAKLIVRKNTIDSILGR